LRIIRLDTPLRLFASRDPGKIVHQQVNMVILAIELRQMRLEVALDKNCGTVLASLKPDVSEVS